MKIIKLISLIIAVNILLYLAGSFLGFSFNPMRWELMRDAMGRFMLLIVFIGANLLVGASLIIGTSSIK